MSRIQPLRFSLVPDRVLRPILAGKFAVVGGRLAF
jgi:hypothetical protein